ncbi:MAG: sigma-54-dependent transcriptional regulator, partial [Planctomycetota bacterium]
MSSARILVVDEDRDCLRTLRSILEVHEVESFLSASEALDRLERSHFDLVVAEQNIARIHGESFLDLAQKVQPNIAVILVTCFGTIETAVAAMRQGAFDYLSKPIVEEELRLAVQRGLDQQALLEENSKLKAQLDRHRRLDNIVGTSKKMAHIFEVVESVAPTKATVLLSGESGTGKSILARAIHNLSKRKAEPFVEVNCGALPDT